MGAPSSAALREGYDSPTQYTNAYFGFTIPLPHDVTLQRQQLVEKKDEERPIFLATAMREAKLTALLITAIASDGSERDLQRILLNRFAKEVTKETIAGRDFWTTKYSSKETGRVLLYVTYVRGYALKFTVGSFGDFDKKTVEKLKDAVGQLQFFDPAKAREMAAPGSLPYPAGDKPPLALKLESPSLDAVALGAISQGAYSNPAMGISFSIPQGWEILTPERQEVELEESHRKMHGNDPQEAVEHNQANRCMRRLFWGKERAPSPSETAPDTVFLAVIGPECLAGVKIPAAGASDAEIAAFTEQLRSAILGRSAKIQFAPPQRRTSNGQFLLDQTGTAEIKNGTPISREVSMMFFERKGYLFYWIASAKTKVHLENLKNAFSFSAN